MTTISYCQHCVCEYASEELWTPFKISIQNEGLLCKNGVGVFECLSDYGIRCQRSHIASIVSVSMLLKNYGLLF